LFVSWFLFFLLWGLISWSESTFQLSGYDSDPFLIFLFASLGMAKPADLLHHCDLKVGFYTILETKAVQGVLLGGSHRTAPLHATPDPRLQSILGLRRSVFGY